MKYQYILYMNGSYVATVYTLKEAKDWKALCSPAYSFVREEMTCEHCKRFGTKAQDSTIVAHNGAFYHRGCIELIEGE